MSSAQTPVVSRPLTYLVGVVLLLVAADLLLSLALADKRAQPDVELELAADLRDQLLRAASDTDPSWLLIGDSVLAGDVMAATVPDWHRQRVIDYLRRQTDADDPHGFYQVALDGLLPTDALAIVTQLDRIDPEGRVAVALELNLRYFSPHYRDLQTCTREWICEAAGLGDDALGSAQHVPTFLPDIWTWLGEHVPIARHRRLLDDTWESDLTTVVANDPRASPPDPLEARARLLAHYRGRADDPNHSQRRALDQLLTRLGAHNRRALVFVTPLEDTFAATPDVHAWQQYGALAKVVHDIAETGTPVRFANFDARLFESTKFIDHCHLQPDGNRLLALNLLHEMGVGLAQLPAPHELVLPEATDLTLLANLPWPVADATAQPRETFPPITPGSLAVEPGGGRLVIADRDSHVLYQLRGSMQTLEHLAGISGSAGDEDGPVGVARFHSPTAPVFVGEQLYLLDRGTIRRYHKGTVSTLPNPDGRRSTLRALAGDANVLYALDHAGVIRIDPGDGSRQRWLSQQELARAVAELPPEASISARGHLSTSSESVSTPGEGSVSMPSEGPPSRTPKQKKLRLRALAVSPEGDVFVADSAGRIWKRPPTGGVEIVFANTSTEPIPEVYGAHYPFAFPEVGLGKIVGLTYVPRYGGLLVQEERPTPRKLPGLTEIVHLHFFHLTSQQVYPWLKPLPYGDAYMPMSHRGKGRVSWLHRSAMALDPVTTTLFVGETRRPRLFRIGDGLYGAARIGNLIYSHQQPLGHLGSATGQRISETFHPEQFVDTRISRLPRKGPYLGLLIGSSMTAVSDLVGQYSLGRRLEQELQTRLGLCDNIRFELYHRTFGAPSLEEQVTEAERFVATSTAVDVVLLEIQNVTKKYFGEDRRGDSEEVAWIRTQLERLAVLRQRYGAEIVLIQNEGIGRKNLDGLRPPSPQILRLVALARQHGMTVVDPTARLLPLHLEASPWGNPPFRSGRHHGSVWAIDRTAEVVASMIYPQLRAHFKTTQPARLSQHRRGVRRDNAPPLSREIDAWAHIFTDLPALAPGRVQHAFDAETRKLTIFVDLPPATDDRQLPGLAARALAIGLVDRGYGPLARGVDIRLANFTHYDEYGQGVLSGATVVFERSVKSPADIRELFQSALR